MPIRVKAPDGSIAQFPDGTPDATIETAMRQTYGGPSAPAQLDPAVGLPDRPAAPAGLDPAVGLPDDASPPEGYYRDPVTGQPALHVNVGGTDAVSDPGATSIARPGQATVEDLVRGDGKTAGYRRARSFAEHLREASDRHGTGGLSQFTGSFTAPLQPAFDGLLANGVQKGINLGRTLLGKPIEITGDEAGRAFADTDRAHNAAYAEKHPGLSVLGGVMGGVAMGPGEAGAGLLPNLTKSVGGRLAFASGLGGAEGAIAAEPGRRGQGALTGAGMGLATAGAFETLGPLASRGWDAVARRFGPAANAPRLSGAERRVANAVQRAVDRDGVPLTAPRVGQLPFETGGENLAGLAEVAAQSPGAARQQAVGVLSARRHELGQKVVDGIHEITGQNPATAVEEIAAMAADGRRTAAPLYDEAYDFGPISSPKLDRLLQRPSVREALKHAKLLAQEEGRDPESLALTHFEDPAQWETAAPEGEAPAAPAKGRAQPKTAPAQGKSLLKFVADNGGIKDPGGEIRAMDGDIWHRRRAFQSKLIGDADSADGWAQRAFEAGYFPERTTAPTQNEFLDAMAAELRGKPRFAREPNRPDYSRQPTREEEEAYRGAGDAIDPADYEVGRTMPESEPLLEPTPTVQTWDYVKRGLDDLLESERDSVTRKLKPTDRVRAIQATIRELRGELTRLNPAYRTALRAGGDPIRLEQAFTDAPKLLSSSVSEAQFAERVAKMGDAEKQAMIGGWASKVRDLARAGQLRPGMYRNPALRAKLAALIGGEKADAIISHAELVAGMQDRTNQVLGNSATARRGLAAADLQDDPSQGLIDTGIDTLFDAADLKFGTAARRVGRAAIQAIPRKDRSIVGGADTNPVLGNVLFGDHSEMTRLLRLLEAERRRPLPRGGPYAVGVPGAVGGLLSAGTAHQ